LNYNSFDNPGLVKVLTFLKTHDTEYLSGQDLSDVLKISRVAVWKHIKKIRELGYKIESKQKLGYRLLENTKFLLPWEVSNGLKTKTIGKRIYYFDSIDSTQNKALDIAAEKNENGTVIIAEKQTDGRGRLGRKWMSPKGGIWISVILHPKFSISSTMLFPIASSLALAHAIEKCTSIKPELKWPNDVTIKGKKVAGMLVDISLESNRIENLVLGVGINFNIDSKKIEKSLSKSTNFYGVDSITNHDKDADAIVLVKRFLIELEKICHLLETGQSDEIVKNWTKRSSTIGKSINMQVGNQRISGKAIKIDEDGALVVSENKKTKRVLVGDVSYL